MVGLRTERDDFDRSNGWSNHGDSVENKSTDRFGSESFYCGNFVVAEGRKGNADDMIENRSHEAQQVGRRDRYQEAVSTLGKDSGRRTLGREGQKQGPNAQQMGLVYLQYNSSDPLCYFHFHCAAERRQTTDQNAGPSI